MKIDTKGMSLLLAEASELSNKELWTKRDERRNAYLLSAVSAMKNGVSLRELDQEHLNDFERQNGFAESRLNDTRLSHEQRDQAEAWQTWFRVEREKRTANQTEGAIIARLGTYNGLGSFVPTGFVSTVFAAMSPADALFDKDVVSYLETSTGAPITVPVFGDIENTANQIGEGVDSTGSEANIFAPGQAVSAVYSFRSPLWRVSIDAFQDIETAGGTMKLFEQFASDRIARGVGQKLMKGTGVNQTLGLVTALAALGIVPIIAKGSAANSGLTETGTNSIGSQDIASLYFSVNEAYRSSPKCAWLMNDNTRAYLASIITKNGIPLINWQGQEGFILGKPIRVCPSLDSIGASNIPVVFGDCSRWLTRCAVDDNTYVQLVTEATGLIENGNVGLRMFVRYGGSLLHTDSGSPAPFGLLQNHS